MHHVWEVLCFTLSKCYLTKMKTTKWYIAILPKQPVYEKYKFVYIGIIVRLKNVNA